MQRALCLSGEQIADLMFLRHVYVLKRHELDSKRAVLSAKVQEHNTNALADMSKVTSVATQLQQNAAEDHNVVHRYCWAVYFGVSRNAYVVMAVILKFVKHQALLYCILYEDLLMHLCLKVLW